MKQLGINKQIIIIAVTPALFITGFLLVYFTQNQFNYISNSLNRYGSFIAKQLSNASEYAIYSGNTESIKPLTLSATSNRMVRRIQIKDKDNVSILDILSAKPIKNTDFETSKINKFLLPFFNQKETKLFIEPIYSTSISVEDYNSEHAKKQKNSMRNVIGEVIITLTTQDAVEKKIQHIKNGGIITFLILLATILLITKISRTITKPIKSLTQTVNDISSGNLDTLIDESAAGEIGVLQSCIKNMSHDLKHFKSDMEEQLSQYTTDLQETMEELEIRNVELDLTRSRAISANRAKSEFLANMSHEIRTPLSGIIGFTELLEGTKLSKQQGEYTLTIKKSANNLLEIINDILDLSKIESGKTEIHTSEFKLIDIIEDIVNLLIPAAYEKNIELLYRLDSKVPVLIQADPFRIHQIITNLLGNAIKFTENGYVYLQITADKIKNKTCNIKFTVADTGIGMSLSDKKKLFKAFTQADATITRRFGGTGLGLIISKKLTQLMKGKIGFDSTLGEGSTFWFKIPVTSIGKPETLSAESILANKKLGIISTHVIVKQIFKSLLQSWHCHTEDISFDDYHKNDTSIQSLDAIIIHVGRKDLQNESFLKKLKSFQTSIPYMLVISTRSVKTLQNLAIDEHTTTVFSFEKTALFKKKLSSLVAPQKTNIALAQTSEELRQTNNWSHINVLLVDDNKINLRLAEIILSKNNTNITTAFSGEQAIDYAKSKTFDIVFMDLHMPGIDGYETSEQIHQTKKNAETIIIALTANAMPQDTVSIKQSGMSDILIKPVNDKMMHEVLHKWLPKDRIINNPIVSHDAHFEPNDDIFSLDIAKEFTNNNETLALELFDMLRAELHEYSRSINLAITNEDVKTLKRVVHKLHGASRCCGTTNLKNICYEIENSLNNEMNINTRALVQSLLQAIEQLQNFKIGMF